MNEISDEARIQSFLADALRAETAEKILSQWKAVRNWFELGHRSLPQPVWRQRKYEHSGEQAWQHLTHHIQNQKENKPISIYIHIPFCQYKCGFCDLYSVPLPKHKRHDMEYLYVKTLKDEMMAWSSLGYLKDRPVTTVHLGGGTPNFLSALSLSSLIKECRTRFSTTSQTEWALESTSRLLTYEHIDNLKQLGFTRLHVGVQTLDDNTRRLIGRKEKSESVLDRLNYALEKDFVVSVDIIYGLPGQTLKHLLTTLEQLTSIGIHGFSLYQLQVSEMNKAFLQRKNAINRESLLDYLQFQAGEYYLRDKGYMKNHFTHFAHLQDESLYYRHANRGEDLLALGATADGVFGNYLYRHPDHNEYVGSPAPVLEGGMMESPVERKLHPVNAALMASSFTRKMLQELEADSLLELWVACDLVEEMHEPGYFTLTANGSWFITDMLAQLKERVSSFMKKGIAE